ncbi:carboxypeptidase-like regulatory domain-containing protein [Variovorax sp. J22R115]|uniref:carboxypeptidase-like regulatory domain-containing protein n=1 Tax=Variovorax sp. J22R115 TaxID=3053509 RepID=UPI002577E143|nr:carboxypeptidase-like regulatory domain-containing protein [Variovorax sp. J22R115]MDM0051915.1 carboxypeptidase-like regulatory domain-containing protein [Variovorax sp. J22R115]
MIVTVDKSALTNTGSDQASLNVVAVDASRNVVASVPVAVTVDSNAVFTPASGSTTAPDGTFGGKIGIGADKSNRLIHYSVKSGTLTKTGAISVAGSAIQLNAVPQKPLPGASVTLTVTVKDASNAGVAGATVTASGIPGQSFAATQTSSNGAVTYTFPAPSTVGLYTIAVESLGVTSTYPLQVSSGAQVPNAVGPVSGASALANPVVVASNASGSTANRSEIRALFFAANNTPIPNMRVRFSVASTALPGESLSTGSDLVYSDATGVATTSYVASTTSSPTNGVAIKACYDVTDFAAGTCPNEVQTSLTVTASPVSLTIGSGNEITKSPSKISYIKQFEIQVVDSAGQAKDGVPLSAVVDIDGYWKGATPPAPPTLLTNDFPGYKWCYNEDQPQLRNGVLDAGEDTNKDGQLTPRQADAAISFVNGNLTQNGGLAQVQLTYPQNVATWLRVKIRVTAGVSGSEGAATYTYILRAAQEDVANGSFNIPPYGSDTGTGPNQGCNTPL